jgi:hypothetical protein
MTSRFVTMCLVALVLTSLGCGKTDRPGTPPATPTGTPGPQREQIRVQVLVSLDGVTVLRYEGGTLDAALAGGNKQKPSKLLADQIMIDEKQPLFGTVSVRIDISEVAMTGQFHESPVQLVLVRKSKDAVEWDLTPEAVAAIKRVKD